MTAVEAARADRRWLTVPLTLLIVLALVLGLVVLAVGAVVLHRYAGESTPHFADDVRHFRYGSIGADRSSGLPYRVWQELPALFPAVFRPALERGDGAYAAFGFLYERNPDGTPFDLPIGISRRRVNGVDLVWFNCAVCHAGTWRHEGGERVIVDGMPSNTLDLHAFIRFLLAAANDDRLNPGPLLARIEANQGRFGLIERVLWRHVVLPRVRGELLLRRIRLDPLLAVQPFWGPGRVDTFNPYKLIQFSLPFSALDPGERIGTADFPSIFLQRPREGMQLHWDGNNTSLHERNLSAAVGAGLDLATATAADRAAIRRVARWLLDLRPPPSPMRDSVDAAAVARGRDTYMRDCASCHGYQDGERYVFEGERLGHVEPIERIGTDRARLDSYTPDFMRQQREHLGFSRFTKTDGYANQPLDGLWLRGPYLHNGSVPTLADLLDSADARPRAFLRGDDTLDEARGGFRSPPCTPGDAASAGRFCLDTTRPGNSNAGHDYGTGLSEAEKNDLLAYLRTF
ncbi:c-type cytochrome [Elioraea sp.]|uniref:c-type cytochrome n=1 Tax=Elioraea sp. TaxID=2185103 RepID=UPI003F7129DF